ncbi:glycosyltransferase family 2 protein [Pseudocercospora fijiensis CIRAD86]|uniref:dolichyl-phosphate beta-glucosyltransferase n=1 Tax=Pseudocercospora fijiensis (strain CIRAD86) TaxID=383855 RepID=M2Z5R7_PSEFD|nr:glycosyltransferase family 2 protein [Pseudocercospora fijiensis CIRAD86]EME85150.1 glycosyltransferase family 2 protein [Pseudocercospora fijiensis CIRAD86]
MDSADSIPEEWWEGMEMISRTPYLAYLALGAVGLIVTLISAYILLCTFAPTPRPPTKSEKRYITITEQGQIAKPEPLPCWFDNYRALKEMARRGQIPPEEAYQITDAECFMTLVIPAYNEQDRLSGMLEEAVEYLEEQYGHHGTKSRSSSNGNAQATGRQGDPYRGWEIILVSDGSTDKTVKVALNFARTHMLNKPPPTYSGPWKEQEKYKPTNISPGTIRVVQLEQNRGKGGAVTHGMRHARGTYVVFADADGASRFPDLGKLVKQCEKIKDKMGRAVGVGSRAHMVGMDAVVKRSALRNLLMRCFHLGIRLLTTPKTSHIKDTQCGFKLFSRPSLPYIIPYMHSEGWIFDVEMLMLAESADIPMAEVGIGWKEVAGSKLNVINDSIGMAVGLAWLRVAWAIGIYRRD